MTPAELLAAANEARRLAHAPYSRYRVGAALLTREGRVYTGCNVENASFGLSICAERVAVFKAVSDGHRAFVAVAIVTPQVGASPCGACRQVLHEFAPDAWVYWRGPRRTLVRRRVRDLLADGFQFPPRRRQTASRKGTRGRG